MRIKISTTLRWPIERQIPADWKQQGIDVVINQPVDSCDAWVVYQGLHRPETTLVPSGRVFFFGYEPPGLHSYQTNFLKQFSQVITCQNVRHRNILRRHQAQPWLAGVTRHANDNLHSGFGYRFDHQQLAMMAPPEKSATMSAICSTKQMVPGHATRIEFVEKLQQQDPGNFDLFGYGFQPLEDKWDALSNYQYHLVLENSCVADYWTEKLADAFLASCVPIVWGCPNLNDYFPAESFVMLDPENIELSIRIVEETIASPPSLKQLAAVAEARELVLHKYNLFCEIKTLLDKTTSGEVRAVRLKDERLFLPGGLIRAVGRALTDRWRASASGQ